jgi:hypothetical protein
MSEREIWPQFIPIDGPEDKKSTEFVIEQLLQSAMTSGDDGDDRKMFIHRAWVEDGYIAVEAERYVADGPVPIRDEA